MTGRGRRGGYGRGGYGGGGSDGDKEAEVDMVVDEVDGIHDQQMRPAGAARLLQVYHEVLLAQNRDSDEHGTDHRTEGRTHPSRI